MHRIRLFESVHRYELYSMNNLKFTLGDSGCTVQLNIETAGNQDNKKSEKKSKEFFLKVQKLTIGFIESLNVDCYSVYLESAGPSKIMAIKNLRDVGPWPDHSFGTEPLFSGVLGLKEAKDMIESAPSTIVKNVPREFAIRVAQALNASGCKATAAPEKFMVMK